MNGLQSGHISNRLVAIHKPILLASATFSPCPYHHISRPRTHFVLLISSLPKRNLQKKKMYRSASWNRFSDEYYSHSSPSPAPSSKPGQSLRLSSSFDHGNELPTNDPVAEMVKREKARVKFAETAVHVIPLVLLLCAVVLWFFSNPGK